MQSPALTPTETHYTVLDAEPGVFGVYGWGDVVIVVWCQQGTGPLAERLKVAVEKVLASHARQLSCVHLVAETPLPTAEARATLSSLITRHAARYGCVSVVLGAAGFWASALRSVVLGMRMLAPRGFLLDFHFDLDTAATWVARNHHARTGAPLDRAHLHSVLEHIAELTSLNFKRRSLPPNRPPTRKHG